MSNAGQAALTIVGTVVGAYFGAPQLGYAIGSLAGQALFPTIIGAPKLTDSTVSSSTEGSPIPLLYGVSRIAASLNWARPIERNKSGGKGGPQQQGYADTITAMYAIGEGPIKGVLRIWVNKKLRYDIRPGVSMDTYVESVTFARGFTFYSGSDTQLPDPTMESFLGVGNVPAFRGLSYLVFHDLDITKDGPRAPLIEVEYVQVGTDSTSSSADLRTDVLFPWSTSDKDPRNCQNDHEYRYGTGSWTSDIAPALADAAAVLGYTPLPDSIGWSKSSDGSDFSPASVQTPGELQVLYLHFNALKPVQYTIGANDPLDKPSCASLATSKPQWYWNGYPRVWSTTLTPNTPVPSYATASGDCYFGSASLSFSGLVNEYLGSPYGFTNLKTGRQVIDAWIAADSAVHPTYSYAVGTVSKGDFSESDAGGGTLGTVIVTISGTPTTKTIVWTSLQASCDLPGLYGTGNSSYTPLTSGVSGDGTRLSCEFVGRYYVPDTVIQVRRKQRQPDNPCHPRCQLEPPSYPGNPDYCVVGTEVFADLGYAMVTGSYKWLADSYNTGAPAALEHYPIGPVILSGSAQDTMAFWDAAYAAAVAAGTLPSGYTYNAANTTAGNQYPIARGYAWNRVGSQATIIPTPVTLGDIATAISLRAGLQSGELAYTALTQVIDGYFVARLSSGREMLVPLLQFAFSDIIEDGAQLVGVVRGGTSVITITEDDLAAREAGGAAPPRITVQRTQPAELPRQLRVHYRDNGNDYQAGMQAAAREYGQPRNPVDIELAISMTAAAARKCAQIYLDEAYAGREQYTPFSLPATDAFLALRPSDTITLPVDGQSRLARITTRDYQFPGLLSFNAVRADLDVYTASPASTPATGTTNAVVASGPSSLLLLDLPVLQDTDNDAGVYVGLKAYLPGWTGASIFESTDGGASYLNVGSGVTRAPYGTISAALPDAPAAIWDTRSQLRVTMATGTLASATIAQLCGTTNYAAVGADGRWEIIQYRDAVLQMDGSYLVSFLVRGLRGTEHVIGSSVAGDLFVPLNLPLQRITEPSGTVGQPRLAKAVTYGTALADAPASSYSVTGLALKPLSPCHVGAGRNAAGDVLISWVRRARLSPQWRDGSDVPLGEETEAYEIEVIKAGAVVRSERVSAAFFSYTAAKQTADFGGLQSAVTVNVYQISAVAGRGFAAAATV